MWRPFSITSGTIVEPLPMYCAQQIVIPPTFPHVLKVFAKAAIRTQPYDLLLWSASYFKALSDGKIAPVKERLEYPLLRTEGGLSPQYLKVLIKQLSSVEDIDSDYLRTKWLGVCLCEEELKQILCTAGVYLTPKFPLFKFAAVAAGFMCKSLTLTMVMLCEIYTDEPDGGNAAISADFFVDLYAFLAAIDAETDVTYCDGYLQEMYLANEKSKKDIPAVEEATIIPESELHCDRWIPKLKGWTEEPGVLADNSVLGQPLPVLGGKVSRNLAKLNYVTEDFSRTVPERPSKEMSGEDAEHDDKEREETGEEEKEVDAAKEEESGGSVDIDAKELGADEEKQDEEIQPPTTEDKDSEQKAEEVNQGDSADDSNEGSSEGDKSQVELPEQDEEETGRLDRNHGVVLRVFSEDGENIDSVSMMSSVKEPSVLEVGSDVLAEDEEKGDEKEDEGSEEGKDSEGGGEGEEQTPAEVKPKLDVSVKERLDIIEELEKNKEKKVNDFMDALESIEDLVEKTKMLTYDADKIGGKDLAQKSGEIVAESIEREVLVKVQRPEKQDVHADAKGVVNPILLNFFNEFYEIVAEEKDTHIPEVITVPGKAGIGPRVPADMVQAVLKYVRETGADQGDMFMPRDLRHCLCPPLEPLLSKHSSAQSLAG